MGNSFSGPTNQAATPRDQRIIEGLLSGARQTLSGAEACAESLDGLRQRLLGLSDPPQEAQKHGGGIEPVRSELAELGVMLERLSRTISALHSKLNDLQGI